MPTSSSATQMIVKGLPKGSKDLVSQLMGREVAKLCQQEGELTKEQIKRMERARQDAAYFINEFCYGIDYQEGRTFKAGLWPGQARLIDSAIKNQRVIALKSRGVGFTWAICWLMVWEIFSKEVYEGLLLSDTEPKAIKLMDRIVFIEQHLPSWLGFPKLLQKASMTLRVYEGNKEVRSLCGNPTSIQNFHPTRIFLDEWALFREPALASLLGALEGEGKGSAACVSTARGIGNEFSDVWDDAYVNNGANFGFKWIFSEWRDRPDRKERPKASKEIQLQEFPETPEEAFRVSGLPYFDQDALEFLAKKAKPPIRTELNGHLLIWQEPIPNRPYVIAADVSQGTAYEDESQVRAFDCAQVLDAISGEQVAELHGRWGQGQFAQRILDLRNRGYRGVIAVERNAMGVGVCEALVGVDQSNLYRHKDGRVGWLMTGESRPIILADIAHDVLNRTLPVHSHGLFTEMKQFGEQPSGQVEAPRGKQDDRVMAMAIARHVWKTRPMVRKSKPPIGQVAYYGTSEAS